jgi:hypothetical protein
MRFSEAMAYYDYKLINISKAMKVSRLTVNAWKERDQIPFKMQCVLQVITDDKLKADKSAWLDGEIE